MAVAIAELVVSLWVVFAHFIPANTLQLEENRWWIGSLGISYHVGLDGISLLMVLLTTVLVPLIMLSGFGREIKSPSFYYGLILIMQSALIGVFTALDGFLFYVFWELALIPIYLIYCLVPRKTQQTRSSTKA